MTLTFAKDNTDKATVAFVIANAALGSEKDTMVFLLQEGPDCRRDKGYPDDISRGGLSVKN